MPRGVDDSHAEPRHGESLPSAEGDIGDEPAKRAAEFRGKIPARSQERGVVAVQQDFRPELLQFRHSARVVEVRVGEQNRLDFRALLLCVFRDFLCPAARVDDKRGRSFEHQICVCLKLCGQKCRYRHVVKTRTLSEIIVR